MINITRLLIITLAVAVFFAANSATSCIAGTNVNLDVTVPIPSRTTPPPPPEVIYSAPPAPPRGPAPLYVPPAPEPIPPPTPLPPREYDQYGQRLPMPQGAPQYGAPPPTSYTTPPPTYAAPPPPASAVVYQAPVVLPATPPQFVFVPELGYYVATGVVFDMLYDGHAYYYHNRGYWYRTGYYGGAWAPVAPRMLPPLVTRFRIADIRRYSAVEFRRYEHEGVRYRGKLHRPERRKEERREERHDHR